VVAEGVETESQMSYLVRSGCDYFQGYYFSKPLSNDASVDFLERVQSNGGKLLLD